MGTWALRKKPGAATGSLEEVRGAAILAARLLMVLAIIAGITLACFRVRLNAATAGFAYLLAVLIVATVWGLAEATVASVVGVLCLNFFFIAPLFTFTVADPENWVGLFAFLATSIVASQLSTRAQQRAAEALDRQRDMERLYALSRSILLTDPNQAVAKQIVRSMAEAFEIRGAALFDRASGEIHYTGLEDLPEVNDRLREAALKGTQFRDGQLVVAAIRLGGEPIGSLALRGAIPSDIVLQGVANLAAIGLEKARAQAAANRAEAARESQELKSTLLDAVAHEFKTPLTAMKAAASALRSGTVAHPDERRELVTVLDEEIDHLNQLVTEAIQMARFEAGAIEMNKQSHPVAEIVGEALRITNSTAEGQLVGVEVKDGLPAIQADGALVALALKQLIDNALRYSPAGSELRICAGRKGDRVLISIRDQGPGIAPDEQPRIFDKFYRGSNAGRTRGTGMGLAIAREIAHAHGGEVWLEQSSAQGSEFCMSLPFAAQETAA
jgi:two-component system, OmpR family, sensor histidine kinase KdpD